MVSAHRIRHKRKESLKQNIWNYMRRNMRFRVGDIMMILEVRYGTIKPIMWALENAQYIRLDSDNGEYKDRIYTFIKNTGIKSPSIINGEVYDHNTKSFYKHEVIKKEKEQRPPVAPRTRLKLLKAMQIDKMSKEEIAKDACVNGTSGGAKEEFSYLILKKVMTRTHPIERRNGKMLFIINKEIRDGLIRDIEARLQPVRSA